MVNTSNIIDNVETAWVVNVTTSPGYSLASSVNFHAPEMVKWLAQGEP
jgi:hypothetical protein